MRTKTATSGIPWKQAVNKSTMKLVAEVTKYRDRLIALRVQLKLALVIWMVLLMAFLYLNGFDVQSWVDTNRDRVLLMAVIVATVFLKQVLTAIGNAAQLYEKFRQMLMARVNAQFCSCIDQCEHRERFLEDMEKEGIHLYF